MNATHKNGFSLLEMTLVLLVLSIVTAGGLSVWQPHKERTQIAETKHRMDVIEKALNDYRYTHHRLPCPADAQAKDREIGMEGVNPGVCINGTPAATTVVNGTAFGAVPVLTLNIPKEYIYDAWQRRFTYMVDTRLTDPNTTYTSSIKTEPLGSITVNDMTGTTRTTEAVYALISHGNNGHGAYLSSGSRKNARSEHPSELRNAQLDASFNDDYDNILVMHRHTDGASVTDKYDDIVRYRERWALVNAADIVIADMLEEPVVVPPPPTDDCDPTQPNGPPITTNIRTTGGALIHSYVSSAATLGLRLRETLLDCVGGGDLDFAAANIQNACLEGADLTNVDFEDANLTGTVFKNAILDGTELRGTTLVDADFSGASMVGMRIKFSDATGAKFIGADTTNSELRDSDMTDTDFSNATMIGADIRESDFINANMTNADISNGYFENVKFTNANLTNVNMAGADLEDAGFINANLTNANFCGAIDKNLADYTGATTTGALCYP